MLYAAALALLALEFGGLIVQRNWSREPFVLLALSQGAVYAGALVALGQGRCDRVSLTFILLTAAVLRVGPLFGPVIWSSDIYRYVWDGWVQASGMNPYCCMPADPVLGSLRDEAVYPFINRRDSARTIYPPFAQMVFAAQAWLGGSVLSMKMWLLAFEAVGIWAMLRILERLGRSRRLILIYAWHPLPIWEIAGSGHIDAVLVAAIPLAVLASIAGRQALSGIALGAAVLTKFIPLVLLPALWRRPHWRMPLALLLFIVGCYLPYLGVGRAVLGYLPGYLEEEHLGPGLGGGFWLVDTLDRVFGLSLPALAYLALCAIVLLAMAAAALIRAADGLSSARWAMVIGLSTVMLFSPHYAWYFVWPIALLTISPWAPGLWPTLVAFLLYWDPDGGRVPMWVGGAIYGGFGVVVLLAVLRRRFNPGEGDRTHRQNQPASRA